MKVNFLKKFIFLTVLLFYEPFFPKDVKASCNFKTGRFIDEISSPNSIKNLDIRLNKPRKYAINSFEIMSSLKDNIDNKYKKKFKANIFVNYEFGSCSYKGKIWQNGDWKDHIKLNNGQPIRSLNVKLDDGNILNATKFKLLIPETRNKLNEIIGITILKNLGFITPETFEVKVSVNKNNPYKMIFQEDSQKELLERNLRREGPIFEGDETLLWEANEKGKLGLSRNIISLSRLINYKWFLRGASSQEITLSALSKLQEAYLHNRYQNDSLAINFNNFRDKDFQDFDFIILAMNGTHALKLHNRKFFFNSLINKFEPIYYDGSIKLDKEFQNPIDLKKFRFQNQYKFSYLNALDEKDFMNNVKEDFKLRVLDNNVETEKFFNKSFKNFVINAKNIQDKINQISNVKYSELNYKEIRELFLKRNSKFNAEKNIISNFDITNNKVLLKLESGANYKTNLTTFGKIISRKKIDKERYLFLPKNNRKIFNENLISTKLSALNTQIIHPENTKIVFEKDSSNSKLIIYQSENDQAILINGGELINVDIFFKGINNDSGDFPTGQRFNKRGLTGCLNIYNATLNETSIEVQGGKCEDSLNIISSKGEIDNIVVHNAFQDAVDLDFSNISVKNIIIKNSGNDCLDVSSGNYFVFSANLENCFDKAISVGEKSLFKANEINISNSNVGFAVKDFSKFINKKIDINNSSQCFQVFQKKQEFGGAYVDLNDINCEAYYQVDDNSVIKFR